GSKKGRFKVHVRIRNFSDLALSGPLALILMGLPRGVRLVNQDGVTGFFTLRGLGLPYKRFVAGVNNVIRPGDDVVLAVEFSDPRGRGIGFGTAVAVAVALP